MPANYVTIEQARSLSIAGVVPTKPMPDDNNQAQSVWWLRD
jgi:hypothetical protein